MKPMTLSGNDRLTKLTSLLYELLRDHVHPGDVERIVAHDEKYVVKGMNVTLSNGHLAEYAKELAERLVPEEAHQIIDCNIEPRINPDGTQDAWWAKRPFVIKDYAIIPVEKYMALLKRVEELERGRLEE